MNSADTVVKLSALAQESRLKIFRLLVTHGQCGLCAGDIAEKTGIAPNTLSFHLKELLSAELISSQRDGRSIIYSLNVEGYQRLITFLTEDCCSKQDGDTCCTPVTFN